MTHHTHPPPRAPECREESCRQLQHLPCPSRTQFQVNMRASALLAALASASLAVSAAIPATGVPITELGSYPDLLTSTEIPSDASLAAAVYAGTSNELIDGTACRAVTLICMYTPVALHPCLISSLADDLPRDHSFGHYHDSMSNML